VKRRKFLKTVGAAAGAAALAASKAVSQTQSSKKTAVLKAKVFDTDDDPTHDAQMTFGLGTVTDPRNPNDPKDSPGPFKRRVRAPGWYPDAESSKDVKCGRLFLEEVIGKKKNSYLESLPVPFGGHPEDSKRWALGSRLITKDDLPDNATQEDKDFLEFVRGLARLARTYNAALYDLRRLHFYWDYRKTPAGVIWPPPNPHGKQRGIPNLSTMDQAGDPFNDWVKAAEEDWRTACRDLNKTLETLSLLAADMVCVNNYIISMRVVTQTTKEVGGSSSHVSLSSAFSSPSP
jgi:hypothetical protein